MVVTCTYTHRHIYTAPPQLGRPNCVATCTVAPISPSSIGSVLIEVGSGSFAGARRYTSGKYIDIVFAAVDLWF
jgi:hypothetical protein